ncbi:MAG: rhodanese-like domain-containing protein [Saprospiraceae bacterium]|nr:rhodanese-like domain-containing protein [Saprospiraceae bacterium]
MNSFASNLKYNAVVKPLAGIGVLVFLLTMSSRIVCQSNSIKDVLDHLNTGSVSYIYAEQLSTDKDYILLDAREWSEFNVSRLPGAMYVGFSEFNLEKTLEFLADYQGKVVVYCTLGVRSEKIGKRLLSAGVRKVYNLWGGIFEWKNNGHPVIDSNGIYTDSVHIYSKKWGYYLKTGVKVCNQ